MAILTNISLLLSTFLILLQETAVETCANMPQDSHIYDLDLILAICRTVLLSLCIIGATTFFSILLRYYHIRKMKKLENNRLNKDNEGDKLSEEDVNKLVNDRINELKKQEAKSEKRRDEEIKAINEICQKALTLKNVGLDVDITFNEGPNQIRISSRKEHKTEKNSQ